MVLHWISVIAVVTSLVTGIRISADALDAVVSKWMEPILPQGEIWSVHIWAGLALFATSTAYLIFMATSGLSARISARRLSPLRMRAPAKLRWLSVNVLLHWLLYGLVVALTITGVLLYLGFGGWVVTVHLAAAFGTLAYTLAHIIAHFGYGGWRQWLRIFRPARLAPSVGQRSRYPLLIASFVAVPTAVAIAALDYESRDELLVQTTTDIPTLDGTTDDVAWRSARPVRVRTSQGANLGGTGESTVEIRAVRDANKIYFAFKWQDPTRSLARLPMIKREDGWRLVGHDGDRADVVDFYEDKLAVIFSASDAFAGGGATHLGPKPLPDRPSSLNERGLHYTTDGSYIDMWQWKASRGGLIGYMDDQYIGPPREATADEAAKRARYQGGYWNDPGRTFYSYNFGFEGPGGYKGPVSPKRLPKNAEAAARAIGTFDPTNADLSQDEGSIWWLTEAESVPYTIEADARFPVGSIMPGVLIQGDYEGDRGDIRAGARWKDGYWTVEASRNLSTASRYDADFTGKSPLYMWVSVFDHNQTRHTRHVRPVEVRLR
ncbi:ethylbenzene dehydrogenase-related protein [Bosea lupini]|uniref:ethylbenzene dehydrogenase-related protein n=1 Tax=Bosea lupini TaxID=1036779 RepID=UPI001FCCF1B7|nr:ethylbenzene dehydrogenase-related protein [Bosea lupini]